LVGAGDDPVAASGAGAVAQGHAVGFDLSGGDPVGTGPCGQGGYPAAGGGDQEGSQAGGHVGVPGGVGLFDHGFGGAADDALLFVVEVQAVGVALAELAGRVGLDRVGEPVQPGEFDGADGGGQQPQCPAGFDRRQLPVVAEQPQRRPVPGGEVPQRVEVAGTGQAGLVDEDHVPGVDSEELVRRVLVDAVGSGEVFEDELVHVLGRHPEVAGEDCGSRCRGRERDQAPPVGGEDVW
jgi:hypothetical protein